MSTMNRCIKVSIIIPVYNTSKYLQECIESACNQTLKEIEIICINDGSTDGSLDIINKCAENDSRIMVLNRPNRGVGITRNDALSHANGEYVGFIDSDDWIDLNMYEELYDHAKSLDSDLTICEFINVDFDKSNPNKPDWAILHIDDSFQYRCCTWKDIQDECFNITVAPWNKLYKRDLITRINAQFGTYRALEDYQFALSCMLNASKISFLKKDLIFHRIGVPESQYARQKSNILFNYFEVIKFYRGKFITDSNFKDAELHVIATIINNLLNNLNNIHPGLKEEYFNRIKKELTTLGFENNPYLDKSIIRDALSIKTGNYLDSKYFVMSYDDDGVPKQPLIKELIKNIIRKVKLVKSRLTQ